MNVTIIGTGYVGLVTGTCLAEIGHSVTCVDIDKQKISRLKKAIMPIYEPGLEEMVLRQTQNKRLSFTTNCVGAIKKNDIIFLAVGTPPGKDHRADLSAIREVATDIGKYANNYKIVVTKSTVPIGTGDLIRKIIIENQKNPIDFDIASNPEFLSEGNAILDFMEPDRIVLGVEKEKVGKILQELYSPIIDDEHPLLITDVKSAEIIKYASNSFLATKISFINEVANFCEKVNADINEVAKGIGLDKRIGRKFLNAGIGYSGSCFPKDVKAFIYTGRENNHNFRILKAVEKTNDGQKELLFEKLSNIYGNIMGKKIAIWGLSFKPNTDDIRYAPSIVTIKKLLEKGAIVRAYDPIATQTAKKRFSKDKNLTFFQDSYEALKGSSALLIFTEWDEFRLPDFKRMKELMLEPLIIDGRNLYSHQVLNKLDFTYHSIGRKCLD